MWTSFIGFVGCGKSTVVRRMRQTTGRVACDLDNEIERLRGCTTAEIFAREGEAGFRRQEIRVLNDLETTPALLLAAGAGVVESTEAVRLLRRRGVVFWLDAPWEVLSARLQRKTPDVHPLVAAWGWDRLRELHARRIRLYAAAGDFRIRTDRLSPAEVAQTALLRGLIWRRRLAGTET